MRLTTISMRSRLVFKTKAASAARFPPRYRWVSHHLFDTVEEVRDCGTGWLWPYSHQRRNMALGGWGSETKTRHCGIVLVLATVKKWGDQPPVDQSRLLHISQALGKSGQSSSESMFFQASTQALMGSMPLKMAASAQRRRNKPTKGLPSWLIHLRISVGTPDF